MLLSDYGHRNITETNRALIVGRVILSLVHCQCNVPTGGLT